MVQVQEVVRVQDIVLVLVVEVQEEEDKPNHLRYKYNGQDVWNFIPHPVLFKQRK